MTKTKREEMKSWSRSGMNGMAQEKGGLAGGYINTVPH